MENEVDALFEMEDEVDAPFEIEKRSEKDSLLLLGR